MGRPKKPEPTEPLRIPRSAVRRIRRLAPHFKMDPGDYVVDRLAATLDRDEAQMQRDIERERAAREREAKEAKDRKATDGDGK